MRKFLLASAATLGVGGLAGAAYAQTAAPPPLSPMQGQFVGTPSAAPPAGANNNNNYQAPALPGTVANPTPGTIVIHFNAKVQTTFQSEWTTQDKRSGLTAPAGATGGAIIPPGAPVGGIVGTPGAVSGATPAAFTLGQTGGGSGVAKVAPYALDSFMRLYGGADGMATNGLRYGAAFEIRQNFTGQISSNTSSGASGYSSLETLYVRRAFTYVAGEQWGIVRFGQADGVIGIFDNGVTTGQFLINNLNGGDNQNIVGPAAPPFFFLAQAGNEYDNAKFVYLSPQIAGFDFGFQWAPNTSNGYGITGTANNTLSGSIISAGTGTGLSNANGASSGAPTLTSGPGVLDGSRATNQTVLGVRYQGTFGGLGLLAYGAYEISGHSNYTGPGNSTTVLGNAILGNTVAGSTYNGKYDGLSFGSGGVALTYAGFTLAGNAIGGRLNGQLALAPQGGAPELAYTASLKYTAGPLTVGVVGEVGWYQGNVNLTGISQRRGRAITAGGTFTVAPGLIFFAEALWQDVQQSNWNASTGAIGSNANNNARSMGFTIGNVVNF